LFVHFIDKFRTARTDGKPRNLDTTSLDPSNFSPDKAVTDLGILINEISNCHRELRAK
jgi:hypothetical protein